MKPSPPPIRNYGLFTGPAYARLMAALATVGGDSHATLSLTLSELKRRLGYPNDAGTCWRVGPAPLGRWWIAVQGDRWRLFSLRGFSGPREYCEVSLTVLRRWDSARALPALHALFSRDALAAGALLDQCYQSSIAFEQRSAVERAVRTLERRDRRTTHSRLGYVSTPATIVEYMVQSCIPITAQDALPRICDPAVGWGAFLIGAANMMLARNLATAVRRPCDRIARHSARILTTALFGQDCNPAAVRLARSMLQWKFADGENVRRALRHNIQVGDSLRSAGALPVPFDVVIGNPPWVSFGLRGAAAMDTADRRYYRQAFQHSAEYKISLFALFMELALRWTRTGGRQAFIVPDSVLTGRYYSKVRAHVLSSGRLESLTVLGGKIWENVGVGRSVIYTVHKEDAPPDYAVAVRHCESPAALRESGGYRQTVSDWRAQPRGRMRVFADRQTALFAQNMEQRSAQLGDLLRFTSGLIGRDGKASIVLNPEEMRAGRDTATGRLIDSGRRLRPYNLTYGGFGVRLDPGKMKSGYHPDRYQGPKIFLNQTGDRLKACVDRAGYYCLNNCHVGTVVDARYSLDFLAAVLNSSVIGAYYDAVSMEAGRALAQTDIDMLHQLPVPAVQFTISDRDRQALWVRIPRWDAALSMTPFTIGRTVAAITENARSVFLHDWIDQIARALSEGPGSVRWTEQERLCDWLVSSAYGLGNADMRRVMDWRDHRKREYSDEMCGVTGSAPSAQIGPAVIAHEDPKVSAQSSSGNGGR